MPSRRHPLHRTRAAAGWTANI